MQSNRLATTLALAATLAASGHAFASNAYNAEFYPFPDIASGTNGAVAATTQETRIDAQTMGGRGQAVIERWEQEVRMYDKAGA